MEQAIFNQLNEAQKKAVLKIGGPSIILAGAGSGKTRVLICKVINLVINHNVDPRSIVMITFTNKAAAEMKTRISRYLNKSSSLGFVGTFHSFCAQILRRDGKAIGINNNFVIYNEDDQSQLIKSILKTEATTIAKLSPAYYVNRISAAKNILVGPERFLKLFSDYNAATIADIYNKYEKELTKNNTLDFDDLILKVVRLFTKKSEILEKYQNQYRYLLVDEFQDTNYAQYVLTRQLGEKYKNVTVVGDFSQSIYSWRGADIRNLENFKEEFPQAVTYHLEQNYRSTQKILDFAYRVIVKNENHPVLHLYTKNLQGEDIVFFEADNEQEEAVYISGEIARLKTKYLHSDMAILYRTNAQSRLIEEAFLHFGIPYLLIGGTRFYERKEIKDILSYLRLLVNSNDPVAKDRIKKIGKKRWDIFKTAYGDLQSQVSEKNTSELIEEIFHKTNYLDFYDPDDEEDYERLENIKELKSVAISFPNLTQFLEQVALVESEYFEKEKLAKNRQGVRLMTLHQAKGLEFAAVFIVGVEEGILPHSRSIDDRFQLEEERRLFYVGVTRAKEKLYITYTRRRFIFGRRGETVRSRFIDDE